MRAGAEDSGSELQRARGEALAVLERRPAVGEVDRTGLPAWLTRRHLAPLAAAGVLDVVVGVGVFVVGSGAWYLFVVGGLLVVAGIAVVGNAWLEGANRVREAARIRRCGPDECDALDRARAARSRPGTVGRTVVNLLYDLVVFVLLALVLTPAWDAGPVAKAVVVALVVGRLAASVLVRRSVGRKERWKGEFLEEEGLAPPPLPENWRVLLDH